MSHTGGPRCRTRRASFWRIARLVLAVMLDLAAVPAWAQTSQKQVLVLYATRRDAQIAVIGDREIPRVLDAGLEDGIDYHSEYMDRARFGSADYRKAFGSFLRSKY